jgi:hypothetical protein
MGAVARRVGECRGVRSHRPVCDALRFRIGWGTPSDGLGAGTDGPAWRAPRAGGAAAAGTAGFRLPSGSAVRASLGLASNRAGIEHFAVFANEFVDLDDVPEPLPARTGC